MKIEADAPGKLVLLGEYAVLDGAPALALAMPQRARVRLCAIGDGPSRLHATPLVDGSESFRLERGTLQWTTGSGAARKERLAWAGSLVQALAAHGWWPSTAVEVALDSEAFHCAGGDKLGLGSSAALTVALARAGARAAGVDDEEVTLAALVRLHRALQGGSGSGVDVAAALLGGTVHYQLDGGEPTARALRLPADLHLIAVATGSAFSTASALARLRHWAAGHPGKWRDLRVRLANKAEAGARAARFDAAALVAAVAEFGDALAALEQASGIEVFGSAHALPRRLAREAGVAYKPSGAGGDLGIAASDDADRIEHMRREAGAGGLRVLRIDARTAGADLRQAVIEHE